MAWNKRIDAFPNSLGFQKCSVEHEVYVQVVNEHELLILCLYVDDLVIIGSSPNAMELVKRRMKSEFKMIHLGSLSYFLGF